MGGFAAFKAPQGGALNPHKDPQFGDLYGARACGALIYITLLGAAGAGPIITPFGGNYGVQGPGKAGTLTPRSRLAGPRGPQSPKGTLGSQSPGGTLGPKALKGFGTIDPFGVD